jgi:hypothetical protein
MPPLKAYDMTDATQDPSQKQTNKQTNITQAFHSYNEGSYKYINVIGEDIKVKRIK